MRTLTLYALPGIPEVEPGASLSTLLLGALGKAGLALQAGDVLVIAQKIISKSEGRHVRLAAVDVSPRAQALARLTDKDPRMVELILRESREIRRARRGVLIVEHRLGYVMANAGIDQSNVPGSDDETVLLLPEDPDASARSLRDALREAQGVDVGVVINDSFGRAWRLGIAGIAIGAAGVPALVDLRGAPDRHGKPLKVTQVAAADELAAAASLVMGQGGEGTPAVLARGLPYAGAESSARSLVRPAAEDLF